MQHPIEELTPGVVLDSAFRPRDRRGFFTRLRLTRTHIEQTVMGRLVRRVQLADIRSFFAGHVSDKHNLRITVFEGDSIVGTVDEVGLWRLRLIELLGAERDSSAKHTGRVGNAA